MKKTIISTLVLASLSLASCQKDRTCTCDTTTTTNGSGSSSTDAVTVGHVTKKEAKRMTNCYSSTQTITDIENGIVEVTEIKVECKLK